MDEQEGIKKREASGLRGGLRGRRRKKRKRSRRRTGGRKRKGKRKSDEEDQRKNSAQDGGKQTLAKSAYQFLDVGNVYWRDILGAGRLVGTSARARAHTHTHTRVYVHTPNKKTASAHTRSCYNMNT